jgi:SAM-dependent methyltransferase
MKLPFKIKLSPKLARRAFTTFYRIGYHFVDLDAESSSLESRVIEYSFVISELLKKPKGIVLDIGCTDSGNLIPLLLTSLGWEVYGIDIREFKFKHPSFTFVSEDIRDTSFPDNFFDYATAVSTLEHIGIQGRYAVTREDPEGDIKAVREVNRILSPHGVFLLTVPYGQGQLIKPLQRVYDKVRLTKMFCKWKITKEVYYVLEEGCWVTVPEKVAASKNWLRGERALALLELTP